MTALVPARALTEAARALAGEATVEIGIEPHQVTFAGGAASPRAWSRASSPSSAA